MLLKQNYSRKEIERLFIFIDRVLYLPSEMETEFKQEVDKIIEEEEIKVGLTWDKSNLADAYREKGKKEGIKEGKKESLQEMIEYAVELKFGFISKELASKIGNINEYEKLKELKSIIKTSDTLEEFREKADL